MNENPFRGIDFFTKPQYTWQFLREHFLFAIIIVFVLVFIFIVLYKWRYYLKNIKPKIEEFRAKLAEFNELVMRQDYTTSEKSLLLDFAARIKDRGNPLDLLISEQFFDRYANEYIDELKKKNLGVRDKAEKVKIVYDLRKKIFM